MSFTNFLETEILDHVFGGNAYTAPATLYVGLFTAAPNETGGGTELSGNGYARQSCAMSVTGNTASNSANAEFPEATGSWGTITHAGIFDASTGGNLLAYASLTNSKTVDTGDIMRFSIGQLQVTLD